MKATLHAPAPWTINRISRWHDGTPKDFDYLEVNSLEGYRVAFAWDCKPKSFATMNLIASAPELLDSLKDLENILSCKPYDRDEQKLLVIARAAIAKAKGEIK
jgi:hypothetical protein